MIETNDPGNFEIKKTLEFIILISSKCGLSITENRGERE
jgi:hypothetical protein